MHPSALPITTAGKQEDSQESKSVRQAEETFIEM
jgi:hypothetical protein